MRWISRSVAINRVATGSTSERPVRSRRTGPRTERGIIMNLDFKNPSVQKLALSVLLSGGLLAVFFFTHFVPFGFPNQSEKLGALKTDYEKKSTELARARATVADLPRFEAEYEQLHQRWSLAAELLPTDRQVAALLRKITLAAEQTGVHFVTFRTSGTKKDKYYNE